MKTGEFIKTVAASKEKQLIFRNADGDAIHRGYHLTEIKATAYDTVDCGGQKNRWNETILQLWVPADACDDYMLTGKFVSIYEKVSKLVLIDEEAEVRIEYGNENFLPTAYHVAGIKSDKEAVLVTLEPPATTCKARDRARNSEAESCCA